MNESERNAMLEQVVCGDLEPSDAAVLSAVRSDPTLRAELRLLLDAQVWTSLGLDELNGNVEEVTSRAQQRADHLQVREILDESGALPHRPGWFHWRRPLLLPAAALMLAALTAIAVHYGASKTPDDPPEPPPIVLGDSAKAVAPSGKVTVVIERFTRSGEWAPGDSMRISVYHSGALALESGQLTEPEWTLTPDERQQIARMESFRWRYVVTNARGETIDRGSTAVTR